MIIGLDVGGTHTDAVLIGGEGPIDSTWVKTRANDFFNMVLAGTGGFDHVFFQDRTGDRYLDASG